MTLDEMKNETVQTITRTATSYKYTLEQKFPDLDKEKKESFYELFKLFDHIRANVEMDLTGMKPLTKSDIDSLNNTIALRMNIFNEKRDLNAEKNDKNLADMNNAIDTCFKGLLERFDDFRKTGMSVESIEESKNYRGDDFWADQIAEHSVTAGGRVLAKVGDSLDFLDAFAENFEGFVTKYPNEKSDSFNRFQENFSKLVTELKKNGGVVSENNRDKIIELVTSCKRSGRDFLKNDENVNGISKNKRTFVSRARRQLTRDVMKNFIDRRLGRFDFTKILDQPGNAANINAENKTPNNNKPEASVDFGDKMIRDVAFALNEKLISEVGIAMDNVISCEENLVGVDKSFPQQKSETFNKFRDSFCEFSAELKKNNGIIDDKNADKISELIGNVKRDANNYIDKGEGIKDVEKKDRTFGAIVRRDMAKMAINIINKHYSEYDKVKSATNNTEKVNAGKQVEQVEQNVVKKPNASLVNNVQKVAKKAEVKKNSSILIDVSGTAKNLKKLESTLAKTNDSLFTKQSDQFDAFRKCLHVLNRSLEKNGNKITDNNIATVSRAIVALEYAKVEYDRHCERHPKPENQTRGQRIMGVQHTMTEIGKLIHNNPELKQGMDTVCKKVDRQNVYKETVIEAIPEKNLYLLDHPMF